MTSMKNWMLGAALVAGGLGLGANPAQAAEFGIAIRGPVDSVPPCPGPGYVWVAGYYNNGYWVPGFWNFAGVVRPGPSVHFDRGPMLLGGHFDRRFDRDHARFRP